MSRQINDPAPVKTPIPVVYDSDKRSFWTRFDQSSVWTRWLNSLRVRTYYPQASGSLYVGKTIVGGGTLDDFIAITNGTFNIGDFPLLSVAAAQATHLSAALIFTPLIGPVGQEVPTGVTVRCYNTGVGPISFPLGLAASVMIIPQTLNFNPNQ